MQAATASDIKIVHTTQSDVDAVLWLFEQVMQLQEKNDYQVWQTIDTTALQKDIDNKLQYKLVKDDVIICVFSIQLNDPFIWRERDKNDAIYLHRIVVHPMYKGQKLFQQVLGWAINFAKQKQLQFIRMDTWASNKKIIAYYKSFGFVFIENYTTPNAVELPVQNRNLHVALLEMGL